MRKGIEGGATSLMSRRRLLASTAWTGGAIATGVGSWVIRPAWSNAAEGSIKVGIATDLTGAIGYAGNADANIARLVVKRINDGGGVLGRPLELLIEDTASNESVAVANVRKLIQRDKVDVVLGGITSSMRNAIKDVIVTRGKTLYIYPQLYEGKECTPYLFCTGPTPAQQCDEFIPWLIKNGGKRFALPSRQLCLAACTQRLCAQRHREERRRGRVRGVLSARPGGIQRDRQPNHDGEGRRRVQHGDTAGCRTLHQATLRGRFPKRGGRLSCVYYDENTLNINAAYEMEGLASCLDYFRAVDATEPFSAKLQTDYEKEFPGKILLTAGSAATGMYRGLKLWEAAVKEAGKVDREFRGGDARPRQDRRRTGRAGGDGAGQAALQDADVHRRRQERHLRDRRQAATGSSIPRSAEELGPAPRRAGPPHSGKAHGRAPSHRGIHPTPPGARHCRPPAGHSGAGAGDARHLRPAAARARGLSHRLRHPRADPRASRHQLRPRLGLCRNHELRPGAVFRHRGIQRGAHGSRSRHYLDLHRPPRRAPHRPRPRLSAGELLAARAAANERRSSWRSARSPAPTRPTAWRGVGTISAARTVSRRSRP